LTQTIVVLPTYNEHENIGELVPMLLDLPVELGVIIVDDNSPDGTGQLAEQLAEQYPGLVEVIHREGKLGLGTAYLTGFRRAIEKRAARIMTMDADFSHHPRYIPEMIEQCRKNYDLVIGSRYVKGGSTPDFPLRRRVLSRGANAFARTLLGLQAKDATAGFRCYRRTVLETIPLDRIFSSGYSFLVEMLFIVQMAGYRVGEVPIEFRDRVHGASKISRSEVGKAIYTVMRLFGRRMIGRGVLVHQEDQ
jgi:glycosyltransferase involved in cell wall biosynthesis